MTKMILAAILWLLPAPSPKWNETPEAFHARMELIAQSINAAAQDVKPAYRRDAALAVAVTFWGESRFSPLIQSGEHRGDGGKALCLGQHHQLKMTDAEWRGLVGTDLQSTTRCATLTVQRLKSSWHYCRGINPRASWPEAFVVYGTGRTCNPEETKWKSIFLDRGAKFNALAAR